MQIEQTLISQNRTDVRGSGGGVQNDQGTLRITNSEISSNRTPLSEGGGLHNSGIARLQGVTFLGNQATAGGGIFNTNTLTLINSTISTNFVTSGGGGGLLNEGLVLLNNAAIAFNQANRIDGSFPPNLNGDGLGGGVLQRGTLLFWNTIIANNKDYRTETPTPDCAGELRSRGHNIVGNSSGCRLVSESDRVNEGLLKDIDPLLNPDAEINENGAPGRTHALLPGSPAINAGWVNPPPPDPGEPGSDLGLACAETDQRGVHRPQGSACDIGAYEKKITGTIGPGGGTLTDAAGSGATFSVGPGVLSTETSLFIDVVPGPGISPPVGFELATKFLNVTLDPNPGPLPGPGATLTLPLSVSLASGTALILFKFDPVNRTFINTDIVGTVNSGGATATFRGVTEFSTFVGASGVKKINNRLDLVKTRLTYNPNPVDNAPAGVFTIASTFKNRSSTPLRNLFFKVIILSGGNLVFNADGGPGGAGAIVSVPAVALGPNKTLDPGESFTAEFKIGLKKRLPFLFFADAYAVPMSGVPGLTTLSEDKGFQFDVTEEHLQAAIAQTIYLPIMIK
jgi:hypothetical protein